MKKVRVVAAIATFCRAICLLILCGLDINNHLSLSNSGRVTNRSTEFFFVPSRIDGRQFDQVQVLVKDIQSRQVRTYGILVVGLFLFDALFKNVHLLKECLGRFDRWKIVGCLGLVDTEGIGQQVHAGFHVVVDRITYFSSLAVIILLCALPINILSLCLHNNQSHRIKEVLDDGISHVGLDYLGTDYQKVMYGCLNSSIVSPLGDWDGTFGKIIYISEKQRTAKTNNVSN